MNIELKSKTDLRYNISEKKIFRKTVQEIRNQDIHENSYQKYGITRSDLRLLNRKLEKLDKYTKIVNIVDVQGKSENLMKEMTKKQVNMEKMDKHQVGHSSV